MKPLAITPGEPAGIGPDIVVQLAQSQRNTGWVVIADRRVLEARAQRLGLPLTVLDDAGAPSVAAGSLTVRHVPAPVTVEAGRLDRGNARYVLETLTLAADGCLAGDYAGVVTGPVQKSVLNDAGIPFSGHTEFFGERAGVPDVLMVLVAKRLRVALATTHLPLRAVPDAITRELLERRLGMFLDALRRLFRVPAPRVLVAGLNPHAGEGGHLGNEETDVIGPVCDAFRKRGEQVEGPLPADTLFTPGLLADADGVLAMYHDQGLPVLKHVGFGHAVNVTVGLPFVRTSVDHGTALDLAGTGRADAGSFAAAAALAATLVAPLGAAATTA